MIRRKKIQKISSGQLTELLLQHLPNPPDLPPQLELSSSLGARREGSRASFPSRPPPPSLYQQGRRAGTSDPISLRLGPVVFPSSGAGPGA